MEKKNKFNLLSLSIVSGVMLWLSWPPSVFVFFLFAGFIPLFVLDEKITKAKYKRPNLTFFLCIALSLFIWNIGTTWWIFYASPIGSVFSVLANTFLMSIPFIFFRKTKQYTGEKIGYLSFIAYWITFEFIHLRWDLSWPWLTIGNGLSHVHTWVQWYEYTGVLGGSLWILCINLFIFLGLFKRSSARNKNVKITSAFILIIIPLIFSYSIYLDYKEKGESKDIVVLQPNIDPYTEKFIGSEKFIPFDQQIDLFTNLSDSIVTPKTDFLLWPETAIDGLFQEATINDYSLIEKIIKYKKKYPSLCLLTGITSYVIYPTKESSTATSIYNSKIGYYDQFNTAMHVNEKGSISFYHKSKLVPGAEIMPYPTIFKFLAGFFLDLGGTSGQLGRQKERTVFFNKEKTGYAPVICYESVYGSFVSDYIQKGASLIFIITNDGWWENTAGHQQHFMYAKLRAIETRRSIARSANTGISGFINQRGDIIHATKYGSQAVIHGSLKTNNVITMYVQYGDYIGSLATLLSILLLIVTIIFFFLKKNNTDELTHHSQ